MGLKIKGFGRNISHSTGLVVRERGREKKNIQISFDNPRSSVGRNLSSHEPKFIDSTKGTHGYQKARDFDEDPKE